MSIFKKVKEEMKFASPSIVALNGDHEFYNKSHHGKDSLESIYSSVVPPPQSGTDPDTCLEVFRSHWLQAVTTMNKLDSTIINYKGNIVSEEVDTVLQHIDQMMMLLIEEKGQGVDNNCQGPILQYLLCEDILEKSLVWSTRIGECVDRIQLHFLKTFDSLVGQANQILLIHKPLIKPLLKLLSLCTQHQNKSIEKQVVLLVHNLCIRVTQNTQILELLFNANTEHGSTKFLIFSLLIPYVHCEDSIGQQARDALLLLMTLSTHHDNIGTYIADKSDFCPVLATGLSALYSSLPRKWSTAPDDWYGITSDDISNTPHLSMFLNSLEFCNAVIQVSHTLVKNQLISYIYNGFLVPVIAPALHQSSLEEVIAATAYFDLFIRKTTEKLLMETFMKFILNEKYDQMSILDSLVSRISSNSRLCMVSLSLFSTLLDLNSEDLMYQLIFKHLVPCTHVMVSQKRCIRDVDVYCKSAEKFLSLTPDCCRHDESDTLHNTNMSIGQQSPNSSRSRKPTVDSTNIAVNSSNTFYNFETSYSEYLYSAGERIKTCADSCSVWSNKYDGDSSCQDNDLMFDQRIYGSSFSNTQSTPKDERWPDFEKHVYDPGINIPGPDLSSALNKDTSDNAKTDKSSSVSSIVKKNENILCDNEINKDDNEIPISVEEDYMSFNINPLNYSSSSESDSALCGSPSDADNGQSIADNECSGSDSLLNDDYGNNDLNDFLLSLKKVKTPVEFITDIEDSISELDSIFEDFDLNMNCDEDISKHVCFDEKIPTVSEDSCHSSDFTPSPNSNEDISSKVKSTELSLSYCDKNTYTLNAYETFSNEFISRPTSLSVSSVKSSNNTPPYTPSKFNFSAPNIGEFLSAILSKLETMMQNSLYVNLLLTGVLSCLACYPQPLLRSFLLNHSLVFQPSVKSLIQVLSGVKQKVERYSSTVKDFNQLYLSAWRFLSWREGIPVSAVDEPFSKTHRDSISSLTAIQPEHPKKEKKRSGNVLSDFFRRSSHSNSSHGNLKSNKFGNLQMMTDGYKFVKGGSITQQDLYIDKTETVKSKNAVYCALVLEEFLKELAAICQEHTVLYYNEVT